MLISQVQRIGKAIYEEKKLDPVEILLELQNPVQEDSSTDKKDVLIVEARIDNLDEIEYSCYLQEFDPQEKSKFLLGLTSGRSTNYSLTLSPSYKKYSEKKRSKGKRSIKFNKMTKILREKVGDKTVIDLLSKKYPEASHYIRKILTNVKEDPEKVYQVIEDCLDSKDLDKFENPLVFKIKEGSNSKFLGEIPAMRKMYEYIYLGNPNIEYKEVKCQLCGNTTGIREGFNLGLFTIDQEAFRTLFFKETQDFSYQYVMCTDCFLFTMLGYVNLRDRLKFYAYSIQEGRQSVRIYHYIIPMAKHLQTLRKHMQIISQAKKSRDNEQKISIQKEISRLDAKIKDLKQQQVSEAKQQLRILKQRREDLENRSDGTTSRFTIDEFIQELKKRKNYIPLLDLYYKITNYQQKPKVKEIVAEVYMSSDHTRQLANILSSVNDQFQGSLRLSSLKNYLEDKPANFLHYYSSLLSLRPCSKQQYQRDLSDTLKSLFINYIAANQNERNQKFYQYNDAMRTYEVYKALFSTADLWRDY